MSHRGRLEIDDQKFSEFHRNVKVARALFKVFVICIVMLLPIVVSLLMIRGRQAGPRVVHSGADHDTRKQDGQRRHVRLVSGAFSGRVFETC
ncbi:hypothetical protein RvY_11836 [Ramazzottius varieornatus]|uniref:Uncharacterized protein n=1 Tax=Ramazzottius varieornatus TaxID=947166 RepID=A0A1D1VR90_RAMVA|nr:hypothetical protein RvY_11836 [Ramazzottius varieornatus]